MTINIVSPLSKPDEVTSLIHAGAREFYCGVMPEKWRTDYTVAASLNRRQEDNPVISTTPHMSSFRDLEICLQEAHKNNARIVLTLNEHYYDSSQWAYLVDYVEEALNAGIDGFIVGDTGLILTILKMAPDTRIHVSTAGTAFNSETIHFYRDMGAHRVILPRHLSLEEIGQIAEKTNGIELEAFILNSRCANIDGFCTHQHGLADFIKEKELKRYYENACMVPYRITADVKGVDHETAEKLLDEKVSWERQHFWSSMHIDERPCGGCALYEFEQWGLAGVKIVGRQNTTEKKLKDVEFINDLLKELHEKHPDKKRFRNFARKLYHDRYERPCLVFKCYYPSVITDTAV